MTMLKQRFIGSISFLLLLAVDISFGGQDITCDAAPRDLTVQFRGASCASHRHGSCVGDRSFGHGQPLPIGLFDRSQSGGQAPVVVYENADPDSFYSVLMIDPDAPSPSNPTAAPWLHWLVVNINGETLRSADHGVGDKTVTEYAPPTPPSGIHRYILLLFRQFGSLRNVPVPSSRAKFDVGAFKTYYDLECVATTSFRTGKEIKE
ncbi:protein MOTHER of FT and TFL1-like [Strongylocentrotus purpuratus]|uniref:Phosphatidylethanolamine-binding protein n=1 Tax=Strongylocentrotus purpuratus TaxID=7668 RepID=A0A7M7NSY6_STRPU|nr:protein MOTHER of FT and TFL1-like [Strongylocentrotus purpuratus]